MNTQEGTELTSLENNDDNEATKFNAFIVDVFKQTGVRITKDDPVLSMALLNEAIQKKHADFLEEKIKSVSSNFVQAIEETPARFDGVLSKKLDKLIQSSVEIDKEIEEAKKDIKTMSTACQQEAVKQISLSLSETKKELNNVINGYKEHLQKTKPFSMLKAIAICTACTLFVTAGLSGAFWYIAQFQKEQSLRFYANGYTDIQKLLAKSIPLVPQSQQKSLKDELDAIKNREIN